MNPRPFLGLVRIIFFLAITLLLLVGKSSTYLFALFIFFLVILTYGLESFYQKKRLYLASVLEPFSGKILIFGLLLFFVLSGQFFWWILSLFLLRDFFIIILRSLASRDDVSLRGTLSSRSLAFFQYGLILTLILQKILESLSFQTWISRIQVLQLMFIFIALALALLGIILTLSSYLRGLSERKKLGKRLTQERFIILANKKSRGYFDGYRRRLLKRFARKRAALIYYLPATSMFAKIKKIVQDFSQVIIAGGDGSFESALNTPALYNKSLGFFPLGSGNAFYSYFYRGKRFEYLRSRFPFREMDLDVLEVEWDYGKRQTLFLTVGIDAEVLRYNLPHLRTPNGFWDYLSAAWKTWWSVPAQYEWKCVVDGRTYLLKNAIAFNLGKVPYYGYGLRSLLGLTEPDDGVVEGLATVNAHRSLLNKPVRVWAMFLTIMRMYKPPLLSWKGREFVISSAKPFPLQAGGEFLGYTKSLKVKVKRKQKVLVI